MRVAALTIAAAVTCSCTSATRPATRAAVAPPTDARCVLIATDDDIPSGSATAGALYVEDASLGRALLTQDVVATARGFLDGGAACVIVLDDHEGAIDPAPLQAIGVRVLTPSNDAPWTWPFFGTAIERATRAALIGFHSRVDQPTGFRPHTINDSIRELRINGVESGEVAFNIMGLGAFGVPVVLISGDMNATAEAAALVPAIERVAVRWRAPDGTVRFLSSDDASVRLHDAARRAAITVLSPYRPRTPIEVTLQIASKSLMAAQAATLDQSFDKMRAQLSSERLGLLGGFDFRGSLRVAGGAATWTAPNALAAYVSIAVAASHVRGPDNWSQVSRGYRAYEGAKYEEAIAAYTEALRVNPYDVATQCRLGAVYQKLGQLDEARRRFRIGFERDDEVTDDVMKAWCALGLAQTESAGGDRAAARVAAQRALSLPGSSRDHDQARKIVDGTIATPSVQQ